MDFSNNIHLNSSNKKEIHLSSNFKLVFLFLYYTGFTLARLLDMSLSRRSLNMFDLETSEIHLLHI